MRVIWIAVRQLPTCFLEGETSGGGVFLQGLQCPTETMDSGGIWTSRDLQREHLE